MRILFLAGLDPRTHLGNAVHVRRLAGALEARGHEVRLLCLGPGARTPADWPGPRGGLHEVRRRGPVHLRQVLAEVSFARLLGRERSAFAPDAVLVRQDLFTLSPLLARIPEPLLVESNASLTACARAAGRGAAGTRLIGAIEGALLRRADRIGAVSPRLREILIAEYKLAPERIAVAPNGTWLPPPASASAIAGLRASRGVAPGTFVAAFAGNLSVLQGLEVLLDAWPRGGDVSRALWIIGEGAEGDRLRARARELGAGSVSFLGPLPEEAAALHAQAAQILVAPYTRVALEAAGNDPLKVLSALACGRPLLTSATGTLARIEAAGAGECVPCEDVLAWSAALGRWEARWRHEGARLSGWPWETEAAPGRALAAAQSWDHTAAAWEALAAAARRAGPPRR